MRVPSGVQGRRTQPNESTELLKELVIARPVCELLLIQSAAGGSCRPYAAGVASVPPIGMGSAPLPPSTQTGAGSCYHMQPPHGCSLLPVPRVWDATASLSSCVPDTRGCRRRLPHGARTRARMRTMRTGRMRTMDEHGSAHRVQAL